MWYACLMNLVEPWDESFRQDAADNTSRYIRLYILMSIVHLMDGGCYLVDYSQFEEHCTFRVA